MLILFATVVFYHLSTSFKQDWLTRWPPWSSPILCDTVTIFVYIDQLFWHCAFIYSNFQGCGVGFEVGAGVGVVRSRRFLGGVGFLTALGVGVGFFCPTPTPDVQLNHFLHHTPKLRFPVEMVQFLLKRLLKQRFPATHHDFHWF